MLWQQSMKLRYSAFIKSGPLSDIHNKILKGKKETKNVRTVKCYISKCTISHILHQKSYSRLGTQLNKSRPYFWTWFLHSTWNSIWHFHFCLELVIWTTSCSSWLLPLLHLDIIHLIKLREIDLTFSWLMNTYYPICNEGSVCFFQTVFSQHGSEEIIAIDCSYTNLFILYNKKVWIHICL